jgi:uncharacterized membrane protein
VTVLVVGLALFFIPHLLPMFPGRRAVLVARWGERGYRGGFSLISAVGLVLIVAGYVYADKGPQLFAPLAAARAIAPWAILLAFILFASSHAPSHMRAVVKHPMLLGTLIWSTVHLAANGDLRGTVLFGAFFAYSIIDLFSTLQRGATASFAPRGRADLISVAAGVVAALLVMIFHRPLFGTAVVPFGV